MSEPSSLPANHIVVLGDIMLDRYVSGQVRRISPEAPIPVLRRDGSRVALGSAGNVAANVVALGARAVLLGVLGEDEAARALRGACPAGVEDRAIALAGRPTTVKTRFMSGAHQLLRLDEEETSDLPPEVAARLLAAFATALEGALLVVLSDYAKGVLCDDVLGPAIAMARARGVPVVVDPKRVDLSAYAGADVVTPNELEVARATGIEVTDDRTAEAAGAAALDRSGAGAVLIKRSAKGLTLVRRDLPPVHLPTEAREVADVSGAGDTLVAALAVSLAGGASLEQAARVANVAAGIVVGKLGTATVSAAELRAALHRSEVLAIDHKVAELEDAALEVAGWRAQGLLVGFTNGCFDLIHPGHVRLLRKARARCDRLVVGLNTDASVARLKGPARPVQAEAARATVMASLEGVDLVVLFAEDTPMRLIETLRPDVLFKGADYTMDQVVGGDFVRSHGGEVVLIELEAGHSTTELIRRMNVPTKSGPEQPGPEGAP